MAIHYTATGDSPDIELEAIASPEIWEQSQHLTSPGGRWRAYLNGLAFHALCAWLEQDFPVRPWPNATALPSFWSLVNGSGLDVGTARLVLIPDEVLDRGELRVPQEWVDIPGWVGDYYVALNVDPEVGTVRFWGFTTHARLKAGDYDAQDRSYTLPEEQLLNPLLLKLHLHNPGTESLRMHLPALPPLGIEQARNLLQRLGSPTVVLPRLTVPFALWGALLEHGGWRQNLYRRRQGLPERSSVLQGLKDHVGSWGWTGLNTMALQGRAPGPLDEPIIFSRLLQIAGQPYELQIQQQEPTSARIWRFQLQSTLIGGQIPKGFVLRLLTEDRQPFLNNETTAMVSVDRLILDVEIDAGEGLVWETEPATEGYDPEVLYFDWGI